LRLSSSSTSIVLRFLNTIDVEELDSLKG